MNAQALPQVINSPANEPKEAMIPMAQTPLDLTPLSAAEQEQAQSRQRTERRIGPRRYPHGIDQKRQDLHKKQ